MGFNNLDILLIAERVRILGHFLETMDVLDKEMDVSVGAMMMVLPGAVTATIISQVSKLSFSPSDNNFSMAAHKTFEEAPRTISATPSTTFSTRPRFAL